MTTQTTYNDMSIYPGEYEGPLPAVKELPDELVPAPAEYDGIDIPVQEIAGQFRIEIPALGFKREDFIIESEGSSLTITAFAHKSPYIDSYITNQDAFEYSSGGIKRHIQLPEEVDPEFVSAEYKNGALSISFLRNTFDTRNEKHRIVVY